MPRCRFVTIVCFVFASVILSNVCSVADVYVSTSGNDTGDGSNLRPFATLAKALKAAEGQGGGTIFMQPGTYYLKQGVRIGEKHGGTEQKSLRIAVSNDFGAGEVRISGGVRIDNFRPVTPTEAKDLISDEAKTKVMVADLSGVDPRCLAYPGDKYQIRKGPELFCNDKRMTLARWPNEGFVKIDKVIDTGRGKVEHAKEPGKFTLKEDRPSHWKLQRGVWLSGYWCHDWSFETLRVADFDPVEKRFDMKGVHHYGIGAFHSWNKVPRRFYAENVFEELDKPGEWWIDREAKRLYFWPPMSVKKARVVLSILTEPLLQISKAKNVAIEGLIFENGSSAIKVMDSKNVNFKNLTVRNLFTTAISISYSTNSGVSDSHIYDVGATGISINCGNRKMLTRGDCYAVGNHIHHFARIKKTYSPAVGLNGVGNRVAKNLIHDAPHAAILYGGNDHLIELNEIHDVALETSDVGAVYTGRDWASRGNLLRWNYIHDLPSFGPCGTTGIYLDDCDSGDRLVGNIFYKVYRAVMIGGGRDNDVIGNVFVDCKQGIHHDARGVDWDASKWIGQGSWTLQAKCEKLGYRSPPWSTRYPRLAKVMDEEPLLPLGNRIEGNIVVDCNKWIAWGGSAASKKELNSRLKKGVKNNLIFKDKDPGFVDAVGKANKVSGFQLKETSPVWKDLPTFKPIPVEKIGP